MAGKGDKRRKSSISRQEEDFRWLLAYGKITYIQFRERKKRLRSLTTE